MSQIIAAFVGGLFGTDGVSAYARPILFGTSGDVVKSLLPGSVEACYFVQDSKESALKGAESISYEGADRFAALKKLPNSEHILVIDTPFITADPNAVAQLVQEHIQTGYGVSVLTIASALFDREGLPVTIKESVFAAIFTRSVLQKALEKQGEYKTISDIVDTAVADGAQKGTTATAEIIAIRDGSSAYLAFQLLSNSIIVRLLKNGVQIFDMGNTYISPDADIAPGAVILPGCTIRGGCKIGAGAVIGPHTLLEHATIGEGTTVNQSQIYHSEIGSHVTVGPFAYIRPDCTVGDRCRIGDFVELKKSSIGSDTKVSHLTYIGDATVGERVNFGCGTVVVNYDGYIKQQTTIGDDCFIGCNTNLVSPVTLGDRAFTAAGATITKDVPAGALAVARAKQVNREGWNDNRRAAHGQK